MSLHRSALASDIRLTPGRNHRGAAPRSLSSLTGLQASSIGRADGLSDIQPDYTSPAVTVTIDDDGILSNPLDSIGANIHAAVSRIRR
jgi:hypothetical protein